MSETTTLASRISGLSRLTGQPLAARLVNLLSAADLARRTAAVLNPLDFKRHDAARDAAAHIYLQAVLPVILMAGRKKDVIEEAVLLLLLLAGEDAYHKTLTTLGNPATVTQATLDAQATAFAQGRQPALKDFAGRLAQTVVQAKKDSARLSPVLAHRQERQTVRQASQTMAQTEAQVTYGTVQLDRLARAGYKTVQWVTVGDERVRHSHLACEAQGPVKLGEKFTNGLRYPGDPAGPVEEIANCRCWLVGSTR